MNASVFLSAANADYSVARAVYQFLTDRGLTCFFCDESLLRVGEEQYRSTVDRALAGAERVVVVAGDGSRAEGEWVKYAWQGFASGTVTGGVRGRVVTVLSGGLERADLPATLRRGHCVSFPAQLEDLPGMLESRNAVADKPPALTGTERRTRRLLAVVTVCNLLILGAMVWLLQWNGFLAFSDSPPPAAPGAAHKAGGNQRMERGPSEPANAASPEREGAGVAATGESAGMNGAPGDDEPAVAPDRASPSGYESRMARRLWDRPPVGRAVEFYFEGIGNTGFSFIPHGKFVMGSPPTEAGRRTSETQQPVTLTKDFWLASNECTQGAWEGVMGTNPSTNRKNDQSRPLPVETVSWDDIASGPDCFLARINKSNLLPKGSRFALPTEAQWEYACRAGTTTPFSFGSVLDGRRANCDGFLPYGTDESGVRAGRTMPVGTYPPNPWGLRDMHGNVWEWCADTFVSDFPGGTDPLVTVGTGRVQRGGSWRFNAGLCRAASRQGVSQEVGDDTLGFRLAIVRGE